MHLWLALTLSASAGDFLVSVGDQQELMMAGTWGRAFPMEDGWVYAYGRNNDYWVAPLTRSNDGWTLERDREIQLTETNGNLKDYAIRRCPNGDFLLAASANVETPNDSAYVWRFDQSFNQLGSGIIEETEPNRAHNDLPLLCSEVYTGTAFNSLDRGSSSVFFPIKDDLTSAPAGTLPRDASTTGASMIASGDGTFSMMAASPEGDLLRFVFDSDLNLLEQNGTPVAEGADEQTYWPQSVLRVGDYYIVAMMSRQRSWPGDDGDILLFVLDDEWNDLYDRVNITNNPEDNLGMRPWLGRKGSTLLVSYDRQREHTLIEVGLDLQAFGVGDDDSGWTSSDGSSNGGRDDAGSNDGDSGAASNEDGCSCASSSGLAPLAWTGGILGLALRRRRS